MKKKLPVPSKAFPLRQSLRLLLAWLLAGWLVSVQVVAATHDSTHFVHEHTQLCDLLGHAGHFPGLAAQPLQLTLSVAPVIQPAAILALVHPATTYPAFHSRAPPR